MFRIVFQNPNLLSYLSREIVFLNSINFINSLTRCYIIKGVALYNYQRSCIV